jgi:CelD/BcsL family acetyltransferase involved in cellulose biosynthesis
MADRSASVDAGPRQAAAALDTRILLDLVGAEPLWTDVLAGDSAASFFAGHAWQSAWWGHQPAGGLLLVLVLRAGQPAGIGPFVVGRSAGATVVRFVATGVSDYGDIIVDERVAARRDVVFAALDAVRARLSDAVLDLEQVPGRSGTARLVAEWAASRGYRLRRDAQDRCPYQRLPPEVDSIDAGLSQSTRRQERRNLRRLADIAPVRLIASGAEAAGMDVLLPAMAEVERAHPAAGRRTNNWAGDRGRFLAEVLASAAATGQLWLSALWVGPTLIAYSVAFERAGVLHGYLQGYRHEYADYGPGTILLLHLQREAVRRGIHTLDYLRGAEPYKLRWQTGVDFNHRLLLRPPAGPVPRLAGAYYLLQSRCQDTLRRTPAVRGARERARRLASAVRSRVPAGFVGRGSVSRGSAGSRRAGGG